MYYSATDLVNAQSLLQNKVAGDSASFLQDMLSIPSFDEFSSKLSNLLPENLVNVDPNGLVEAFNTKNLTNIIEGSISDITSQLQQNATSLFKSVAGNFPLNPQGVVSLDQLQSAGSKLAQIDQKFAKVTSEQMISIFNNNSQGSQLGNLNFAIDDSFAKASKLSPKGVRDLNTPDLFNRKTEKTVQASTDTLKNTSFNMVQDFAGNKAFNNSAQTNLQQLSVPQFSGDNTKGFDLYVRRTVYWAYGSGTDIDSANLRSSTGRKLQEGISAAVDPSIIPYLSRIEFPDLGVRFATDTGGAVKARTASSGTTPIIDVFFQNKEDALAYAKSSKPYVTVRVYPPQSQYKYVANSAPTYGIT